MCAAARTVRRCARRQRRPRPGSVAPPRPAGRSLGLGQLRERERLEQRRSGCARSVHRRAERRRCAIGLAGSALRPAERVQAPGAPQREAVLVGHRDRLDGALARRCFVAPERRQQGAGAERIAQRERVVGGAGERDRLVGARVRRCVVAASPERPGAGGQPRDRRVLPVREAQGAGIARAPQRRNPVEVLARLDEPSHAQQGPADGAFGDDRAPRDRDGRPARAARARARARARGGRARTR